MAVPLGPLFRGDLPLVPVDVRALVRRIARPPGIIIGNNDTPARNVVAIHKDEPTRHDDFISRIEGHRPLRVDR